MKPISVWNLISGAALVALIGAIAFYLYAPTPAAVGAPGMSPKTASQILDHSAQTTQLSLAKIENKQWSVDEKELSGIVLERLSMLAEKLHVKVTDLRLDQPALVQTTKEAAFTVMVDGDFPHVMDFVSEIERSDSKLALSMLQITASDKGPGIVKATLRLTAFLGGAA